MRITAQRPEHVIAAAWASKHLRERGVAVAHVAANGVRCEEPEAKAASLRGEWLAEPRKEHLLGKIYKPLGRLHDRVVSWWKGDKKTTLALPPPRTTWLPEHVRDSVTIEIASTDGQKAVIDVPFIRRQETMSLIDMSSAFTLGAAAAFIPAAGNLFLIPGVLLAGARACLRYAEGDGTAGTATLLTGMKLALFCLVDCIPVVANATFTATLARTRSAFERYRAGFDLLDTEQAEKELEALIAKRQTFPSSALETAFDRRLNDSGEHLYALAIDRGVVRS